MLSVKLSSFISCGVAASTSTSKRFTANGSNISPFGCPSHSNWLLWLRCPMYHGIRINHCLIISFIHLILLDLPLLDRVGSKYPYRDHSFVLGNRVLRSVDLSSFDKPISILSHLIATWMTQNGAQTLVQDQFLYATWVTTVTITTLTLSMAVNTLTTGLIVFKILIVFLEVKATMTSVERTLGSTGGAKLRHIIFVIIESGMALFSIQLARIVLSILDDQGMLSQNSQNGLTLVVFIHQMFNVIIRSVHFWLFFFCFYW